MFELIREALRVHLGLATGHERALTFAAIGRSDHSGTSRDIEELLEHEWNCDDPGRRRDALPACRADRLRTINRARG